MTKSNPIHISSLTAVAKNAGMGIGGQVFFLLIRFVTVVIITRAIGPQQYGTYVLALSIVGMVEVLGLLGLEQAMVKYVAQYKVQADSDRMVSVLSFGFKATFFLTALLSVLLFTLSDYVANRIFHHPSLAPVLRILLLGVTPITLTFLLVAGLQGAKLIRLKITVQQILVPVFRFMAVVAVLGMGYKLIGVAWVWTVTAFVGLALAAYFAFIKIGPFFKSPGNISNREIISFSLPLLLSRVFTQNINIAGILIIGMFLTTAEVGIYGVAMRTIPFLLVPLIAFNAILSPLFSELYTQKKMGELKNVFKIGCKWVIVITWPICILMIYFSDVIIQIFGNGFAQSAQVMTIILVGHMVNAATGASGLILSMTGRPMYLLFNSGGLFILNIILTIVLLDRIGIMGAAYAYSASIIIIQGLQLIEIWILYKIQPYSMENMKSIIAGILALVVIYFLDTFAMSFTWNHFPISGVLVYILCYTGCLLLAGFSLEDRLIFNKFRNRISIMAMKS